MPKRIQRKREKGWRMPEGAVYVGRPGIFGNPFVVGYPYTLDQSLTLYRMAFGVCWSGPDIYELMKDFDVCAHSDYQIWIKRFGSYSPRVHVQDELRGKDLACWCNLSKACHADILLEIANQ